MTTRDGACAHTPRQCGDVVHRVACWVPRALACMMMLDKAGGGAMVRRSCTWLKKLLHCQCASTAGEGECMAATSALLEASLLEHSYSPEGLAAAVADAAAEGGGQ